MGMGKIRETESMANPLDRLGLRLKPKRTFVNENCFYLRNPILNVIRGLLVQQEDQHTREGLWGHERTYIILISIWKIT